MVVLILGAFVPTALYVLLSTSWAQVKIRVLAQNELSSQLGTEVKIGSLEISPFSKITIGDVEVKDDNGATALRVKTIRAAFEFWTLVRSGKIVVDYALIDNPEVMLYKNTPESPLNIDGIIKRLTKPKPEKQPSKFRLRLNNLVIRSGMVDYSVKSTGLHHSLKSLAVNAYLPQVSENRTEVKLERLSFETDRGFILSDLTLHALISEKEATLNDFNLKLSDSELRLGDISISYPSLKEISSALRSQPLKISILPGSNISLADVAPYLPAIDGMEGKFLISLDAEAEGDKAKVKNLNLSSVSGPEMSLSLTAEAEGIDEPEHFTYNLERLTLYASAPFMAQYSARLVKKPLPVKLNETLRVQASGEGSLEDGSFKSKIIYGLNTVDADLQYTAEAKGWKPENPSFTGRVALDADNISRLLPGNQPLGAVTFDADFDLAMTGKKISGGADVDFKNLVFKGHNYRNVSLSADFTPETAQQKLEVDDPELQLNLFGNYDNRDGLKKYVSTISVGGADFHALGLTTRYPGYRLRFKATAEATGNSIDALRGRATISDLLYAPAQDDLTETPSDSLRVLALKSLVLESKGEGKDHTISIDSDYLKGEIDGEIYLSQLKETFTDLVAGVFPALVPDGARHKAHGHDESRKNSFDFEFTASELDGPAHFFSLPVTPVGSLTLTGHVNDPAGFAFVALDIPYISQGDKIIDDTSLFADIDSKGDRARVYFTSHIPTKKGPMALKGLITGASDRAEARIDWNIERKIPLNGRFDISAAFSRNEHGGLMARTDFNPGTINFGSEVWNIGRSAITYADGVVDVDNFSLTAGDQHIAINGVAGPSEEERLTVDIRRLQLIDIFETLEIDKAMIGGEATGRIEAGAVLGKGLYAECHGLEVDSISYNRCVLGTGHVKSRWDPQNQGVWISALIDQPDQPSSKIEGYIFPMSSSLDLRMDVHHARVGFMKPFMEAFTSDVRGYASGKVHLYGTFSCIDMTGDVFAQDLQLKIDFTNVVYTATDSIHITPGRIELRDITVRDPQGHTATLNGVLTHEFFKKPVFDFRVTGARNFLCYNTKPSNDVNWYGTIYGNGSATVKGWPGTVEIGARMTTAPKSTFTFVLSDQLEADDFTFITFRDRAKIEEEEKLLKYDDTPAVVRDYRERQNSQNTDKPSDYNIGLQVDITPDAEMHLIMDPAGGDEIKASGKGSLKMDYKSADNDLRMYGIYTLDRGTYNFTLQDIIIKDFTIREGSSIAFQGDPYAAKLNIDAAYSVNANLSDLDESFLQDKDLTRTNVPVNALLKVTGDMRQPDIDFDLEFPTLTSDVYRKVRSIVSTKEMMNRQIIYLLALNRFYTPDYMNTTKGNELFSVASSTLSSQLSSMLGKLSNNWSIAPNLRSDRGDFSDIEVDLALSSRLLNNRLLFNGNFGYRDNDLNNNKFIGDFDIEYLLNRPGSWRLKAYNRYNDRNFYVRTATTTQGVGVMFKKDFDNMFNFLKPKKKKSASGASSSKSATTGEQSPAASSNTTLGSNKADSTKSKVQPDTATYPEPVIFR